MIIYLSYFFLWTLANFLCCSKLCKLNAPSMPVATALVHSDIFCHHHHLPPSSSSCVYPLDHFHCHWLPRGYFAFVFIGTFSFCSGWYHQWINAINVYYVLCRTVLHSLCNSCMFFSWFYLFCCYAAQAEYQNSFVK